jgi:hypothetical protein
MSKKGSARGSERKEGRRKRGFHRYRTYVGALEAEALYIQYRSKNSLFFKEKPYYP